MPDFLIPSFLCCPGMRRSKSRARKIPAIPVTTCGQLIINSSGPAAATEHPPPKITSQVPAHKNNAFTSGASQISGLLPKYFAQHINNAFPSPTTGIIGTSGSAPSIKANAGNNRPITTSRKSFVQSIATSKVILTKDPITNTLTGPGIGNNRRRLCRITATARKKAAFTQILFSFL